MNDVLDNNFIDPSTVSPRGTGMKYGPIWAVLIIIISLAMYLLGFNDLSRYTNPSGAGSAMGMSALTTLLTYGVGFYIIYLAIKHHRDNELGGYISLNRCAGVGFWTGLIYGLIIMVWTYIFLTFISPMSEMTDQIEAMYEAQGMDEEQIEMAMGMVGWMMSPLFMSISRLFSAIIGGVIFALIVGIFTKKELPHRT